VGEKHRGEVRVLSQLEGEGLTELLTVCGLDELPVGAVRGVEHEGRRIMVVNYEGRIYAMEGTCTHEEADLSMGFLLENRIMCPLHFSQFDVTTGEALNPPATLPLRMFNVQIQGAGIYVEVPEP